MKRFLFLLVAAVLILGGCEKVDYSDVTPTLNAIETIYIQRTNIDENNEYTYYEKVIDDAAQIEAFCARIDKLGFVSIDPIEFNSVDYLIVFAGPKNHKILFSGDQIIYDGKANQLHKGTLIDKIGSIYAQIETQEVLAESRLFR